MGVFAIAVAVVAVLAVLNRSKPAAKFNVGDVVQMTIAADGRALTVLDRQFRPDGWNYQVTRRVDAFAMPAPGGFRSTISAWWTAEANLEPWSDPALF